MPKGSLGHCIGASRGTNYDTTKGHDEGSEGQEDDKTIAPDWFMVNLIEGRL